MHQANGVKDRVEWGALGHVCWLQVQGRAQEQAVANCGCVIGAGDLPQEQAHRFPELWPRPEHT